MLIYNTTYHLEDEILNNFLIWIKESYIPEVKENGKLKNPRLTKILSHRDTGSCYSLQWEVEDSAVLHSWHSIQGARLNEEMKQIFGEQAVGFPTLMEVIE